MVKTNNNSALLCSQMHFFCNPVAQFCFIFMCLFLGVDILKWGSVQFLFSTNCRTQEDGGCTKNTGGGGSRFRENATAWPVHVSINCTLSLYSTLTNICISQWRIVNVFFVATVFIRVAHCIQGFVNERLVLICWLVSYDPRVPTSRCCFLT